jgi:hypothetical protein
MYKSVILCLFLVLAVFESFGQTSINEKTGFWPQGSSWGGGTVPGTISGGTISATLKTIVISGTVKSIHNITISTSTVQVNAGDTLVILGDFTMTSTNFANNGVVIVFGDFSNTLSASTISGTGKLVVTGDYDSALGANTFTGPSYVFGNTSGIPASAVDDQGDLIATDPTLNNYVNTIYAAMPIELVYFRADVVNASVMLSWETASESKNDHFLVERMKEGESKFETIATIQGAGDSKDAIQYEYFDYSPIAGQSYYRLAQVDYDGTTSYFNILTIFTEAVAVTVYPNPATEYLFLNGVKVNSTISITDLQGENQSRQYEIQELSAGQLGIDVRDLEVGTYSIRIADDDSIEQLKFIKQ